PNDVETPRFEDDTGTAIDSGDPVVEDTQFRYAEPWGFTGQFQFAVEVLDTAGNRGVVGFEVPGNPSSFAPPAAVITLFDEDDTRICAITLNAGLLETHSAAPITIQGEGAPFVGFVF